jgi:hypothetical protein
MSQTELQAKTYLFIEYLKHEKGISYGKMAERTGLVMSQIASHALSAKRCYRFCMAFRKYVDDFDEYYGWRKAQ